jgi:hypothetical protein
MNIDCPAVYMATPQIKARYIVTGSDQFSIKYEYPARIPNNNIVNGNNSNK